MKIAVNMRKDVNTRKKKQPENIDTAENKPDKYIFDSAGTIGQCQARKSPG